MAQVYTVPIDGMYVYHARIRTERDLRVCAAFALRRAPLLRTVDPR